MLPLKMEITRVLNSNTRSENGLTYRYRKWCSLVLMLQYLRDSLSFSSFSFSPLWSPPHTVLLKVAPSFVSFAVTPNALMKEDMRSLGWHEVEVRVARDDGQTVEFNSGKVMLVLHFRKT